MREEMDKVGIISSNPETMYLGDNVYVTRKHAGVWLTTSSYKLGETDITIALEPRTLDNLIIFLCARPDSN